MKIKNRKEIKTHMSRLTASSMLLQILTAPPVPTAPQWTILAPMSPSTASALVKVSPVSAPTMNVRVPPAAAFTPPVRYYFLMKIFGEPYIFVESLTRDWSIHKGAALPRSLENYSASLIRIKSPL